MLTNDADYPDAPEIGGDSHEVAAWLKRVSTYVHRNYGVEEGVGVDDVLEAFQHANPETK